MADEPVTRDLLEELVASPSIDAFCTSHETRPPTLAAYANQLLEENGVKRSAAIRASGLNETFGYQIFAGSRKASRDKVIRLAFGLRADLKQTQRLLKCAGWSELYVKNRRDAILIFCVLHGYSRERADDELFRLGEETLL